MDKIKQILLPVLLFALVIGLIHWHGLTMLRTDREALLANVDILCAQKAEALEGALSRLLNASEMLGMMLRQGTLDRCDFDAAAAAAGTAFPGVEGMGFAPEGVSEAFSHRMGIKRGGLGGLWGEPGHGAGSDEVLREPAAMLSGPFKLFTGQIGFMGRFPVIKEHGGQQRFWGFVTAVTTLDTAEKLAGLKPLVEFGYVYGIEAEADLPGNWDVLAGELIRGDEIAVRPLQLKGVRLRLLLGKADAGAGSGGYWASYVAAVAFALVLSGLFHLLLRQPARLRALVSSRTAKLREVNKRLAGEIRRRRQTSRKLDASQELNRTMFENNPAVKLLVDPHEHRVVEANPAAARFYGWSREDLAGMPISDINVVMTPEEIKRCIAQAMSSVAGPIKARHRLASGDIRDVEIYSGPVRYEKRILLQSVVQDVTERENARRELKESRERLEALFNSVESAIAELNDDGRILLVNQGFVDMFGIEPDKAVGMSYLDITHPDDVAVSKQMHAVFTSGRAGRVCLQKRYLRSDGSAFWGNVCITCVRGASGEAAGTVAVITDVTQLLEAKSAAEEASRAKSRFLANISHEVRSPLNAVMGLTELTMRSDLEPKQRDNLEKSLASCRALLAVIESILEFAHIESGRMELVRTPFCPADLLGALRERFGEEAAAKGLALRFEGGDVLPPELVGDPVRLEQILANLVSNAVKFTEQGEVVIGALVEREDWDGARLAFSVSDTGIGMEEGQAEALFKPFNQAETGLTRVHGGTGLGLSVARGLVELMGGELEWESSKEKGSSFSFRVELQRPRRRPASPSGNGGLQDLSELMRGLSGMRVLIVDDNPLGRYTARELLGHAELVTAVAESGPLAVEAIRREQFDVVLLDLNMPGMDGFETLKAIRELPSGGDLPVIALTGRASDEDRIRFLTAGMDDHLTKPLDAASLYAALRLFAHRRDASQEPASMDSQHALVLLMGNKELYARLLKGFVREYGTSGRRMGELIAAGAAEDAAILAHSIKGLAANLGGERLSKASLELEAALRATDLIRITAAVELFEHAVSEFSQLAERTAEEVAGKT